MHAIIWAVIAILYSGIKRSTTILAWNPDDTSLKRTKWICFLERRQKAFTIFLLDEEKKKKYNIITTPTLNSQTVDESCRQSTLGYTHGSSLSVDGAQATNSMVTQDTDKLFIQVRSPCGRNTYVLRLVVLICVERIMCPNGGPLPLLI